MVGSRESFRTRVCRSSVITAWQALLYATAIAVGLPVMAMADSARFQIAAQPLETGLKAFAEQADMEILYQYSEISGIAGNAVVGDFDKHVALERLLRNTGLEAVYSSAHAATIRSNHANRKTANAAPQNTDAGDRLRVAEAPQGGPPQSSTLEQGGAHHSPQTGPLELQEVVVTAQKRSERALDVPVPVTALSGQALLDANQLRLQDYYNTIPGLNVSPSAGVGGYQLLAMRGLTSGLANPTVGITIDDVPFGPSTVDGGNIPPDIDPGELARVEVLRGPQGTLYGASSIGGLIKYVTLDPSTDAFSGRVQVGTSDVRNGAQPGYNTRISINAPLSDSLAIRASAFTREDPGYIDNPILGIRGVNKTVAYGAHLALLWRPSDAFSLKISALAQQTKAGGSSDVDISALASAPEVGYPLPPLGDLQQDYIPGAGQFRTEVQ